MKKLYKKGTVHPSPQVKPDDHLLHLLPVAIFSLTSVLSPEDREVLAYLLLTASRNPTSSLNKTKGCTKSHFENHSPLFYCDCFSCYMSYWVRWDSSPSRQLIHEIIDAFEVSLENTKATNKKNINGKKNRRNRSGKSSLLASSESSDYGKDNLEIPSRLGEPIPTSSPCSSSSESADDGGDCNGRLESPEELCSSEGGEESEEEKGTVRRFVNFIGEKVFSVWG